MAIKKNLRKGKLEKIEQKLAIFIYTETFTDESDVQKLLSDAIGLMDQAAAKIVENDNRAANDAMEAGHAQ